MGNYNQHLSAGKKYTLFIIPVSSIIMFQLSSPIHNIVFTALISGVYGLLGSLLPDIDHQDSIPRQVAGKWASITIFVAIILLPTFFPSFVAGIGEVASLAGISGDSNSIGSGIVLIGGVAALVLGGDLFDNSFTHRGFTHSLPFAFLVGVGSYFLLMFIWGIFPSLRFLSGEAGVVAAMSAVGGVFVHLYVDGII